MDERAVVDAITEMCENASDCDVDGDFPLELTGCRTISFEEEGVLTSNKGFVLKMPDGSQFQVSVVQSKRAS